MLPDTCWPHPSRFILVALGRVKKIAYYLVVTVTPVGAP